MHSNPMFILDEEK